MYISGMEKIDKNVNMSAADKVAVKRPVTITVNAEQIKELGENKELRDEVVRQLEESEGGLKGTMAIAIAKAVIKQLKIKV